MVDPITLSVLAGAKAIGGFLDASRQKAFVEAINEAKINQIDDMIIDQKLDKNMEVAQIQGAGAVKAGSQGIQFSGSILESTRQAVFTRELAGLRKIRDLQYQKLLTQLGGDKQSSDLTAQQIGAGINLAGDVVKINQQNEISQAADEVSKARESL